MTTYQHTETEVVPLQSTEQRLFPLLLTFACIFEFLYLILVALSPLTGLHLTNSPLSAIWSQIFLPSHWFAHSLIGVFPHRDWFASLLLGITFLGLVGTYACAIACIFRRGRTGKITRHWFYFILGGTLIFGLTLLFQPKLFSDDVFTYIFSGRILTVYGADPLNTAPNQFPFDPYLPWVISGRGTPNIYGPLWLCIASVLVRMSNDPLVTLLLFKGVTLLAHLVNSVLIWAILGRIAPARRLLGTFLYAWNPLALIELAGSGHSEGVLLSLLLLVVWFYIQEKKRWLRIGALVVMGLAISTNLIALLLAPLAIWFDVRSERSVSRALWGFCWRALIMLIPALIVSLPFWRGEYTFFAITSAIDMEHFVHSPVGTLAGPMRHLFDAIATWGHFRALVQPTAAADVTLRASATFIFTLIYINLFSQIRRAPDMIIKRHHSPEHDSEMLQQRLDVLLKSCSVAIFWYLILVSGWFWPWYILWMFWLIVLRQFDEFSIAMLILSGTALFIYPFVGFSRAPIETYQAALIFGIPLIYLIIVRSRQTGKDHRSI